MSISLRARIVTGVQLTLFFVFFLITFRLLLPFYLAYLSVAAVASLAERLSRHSRLSQKTLRLLLLSFFLILTCLLFSLAFRAVKRESAGFFTQLYESVTSLLRAAYRLIERIKERFSLGDLVAKDTLEGFLSNLFSAASTALSERLTVFAAGVIKALPGIFLSSVIYLLASLSIAFDFEGVKATAKALVPERFRPLLKKGKTSLCYLLRHTLKAYGILFLITFLVLSIAFIAFRFDYPIWWALLTASLDALPAIGIGIVLIPRAIALFLSGNTASGTLLLLFYLGLTLFRQAIEPRILGKELGVKPLVSLLSLYLGFRVFGILGIIVSPLVAVLLTRYLSSLHLKKSPKGDAAPCANDS